MANAQILLVEDELIVAKDVQHRLQGMGYTVSGIAATGEEALEKAGDTFPDLVLMDVMLKGNMDGVEASELLRRRYQIPVVFLTAYADDDTLERAKLTEPYGYLLKPFEERELHTTIEIALFKNRMERKLRETEQWLEATLCSIGDAMIATDARGLISLINPSAEALIGRPSRDAAGKSLLEVLQLVDEHGLELSPNPVTKALRTGTSVVLPPHAHIVNGDGRKFPVEGTVAPIHDKEGNLAGLVLVVRDITLRQRHEEMQHRLDEHQHQAQKMDAIGRLAGGVAHDFNNLLTVVLGNTSMVLASAAIMPANRTCLESVEQAGLRAAELVRKLQGFARQNQLRLETINLSQRIRASAAALRAMLEPAIAVKLDLADDLWPVQADAGQMHQVLLTLAVNARDAMPDGGMLHVETENVTITQIGPDDDPERRRGEHVCVRVRDSGQGMAPELRSHLFEPFSTTKGPTEGVGLDLAMVHGIIEQQHGWIECHMVEPGTRFDIYLPRYLQEREIARTRPGNKNGDLDGHMGQRRVATILLADDEPMLRDLGRKILEDDGYEVILAEDGMQAIELFQRQPQRVDLVILDMKMPRLSGADAFSIMLGLDPNAHALFLSGLLAENAALAGQTNVLGFIPKPYHISDMIRTVRHALNTIKLQRGE